MDGFVAITAPDSCGYLVGALTVALYNMAMSTFVYPVFLTTDD